MASTPDRLSVVLGAGPVGIELAETLHRRGEPVRLATRGGVAAAAEGVEVVRADVSDPEATARACGGASVVYGCVGRAYTDWPTYWPPMMEGMLHGAESAGARFVFLDNLYSHGPVDEPMREEMALTDYGTKPAVRSQLARMWKEAHDSGRIRAAAVRASDFYGPGVTAAMLGDYTFGRIAEGKAAQVVGDPDQPHTFTYVPDVVRALITVAEADDDAFGQSWNVPNAPTRSVRSVLTLFAKNTGHELKLQKAPRPLITVMGLFNSQMRELKEMLYQWDRPFVVDDSKFRARFWDDPVSLEDGISATARWYMERAGSAADH